MNLDELEGLPAENLLTDPEAKFTIYTPVQILKQLDDDLEALINRTYWETPSIPLTASENDTKRSYQLIPRTDNKPI